jgi:hypothetical protein
METTTSSINSAREANGDSVQLGNRAAREDPIGPYRKLKICVAVAEQIAEEVKILA